MRLTSLMHDGYAMKNRLNCAEAILRGCNEVYHLGMDNACLKLAAGFGGGMGIEDTCGAVTGSIMVLGRLFANSGEHDSPRVRELCVEFLETFRREMGDIKCTPLKAKYRIEEIKCRVVIEKGAEVLERILERENREARRVSG